MRRAVQHTKSKPLTEVASDFTIIAWANNTGPLSLLSKEEKHAAQDVLVPEIKDPMKIFKGIGSTFWVLNL